jgi:transposase-like protein
MEAEKRPQDWSAEERFAALVETAGMSEEERGVWCRAHGLHGHQLASWRRDAVAGSLGGTGRSEQTELNRLRQEAARLKKELARKDRALAETTALLVLQKKARLLWGEDEDS